MFKQIFFIVVLIILLNSCSEDIATDSDNDNPQKTEIDINGLRMSVPPGISSNDITGRIILSSDTWNDEEGYENYSGTALAYFFNDTYQTSVDAGEVSVNGTAILKGSYPLKEPPDSIYSYLDVFDVDFNETNYTIAATGSINHPSFSFNVESPGSEVVMTQPAIGQQISQSQSYDIMWNCLHDTSNNNISIAIHSGSSSLVRYVQDTGVFTIQASDLSTLDIGLAHIEIKCFRYALHDLGSGKYVVAVVLSSHSYFINITS